jgi:hypothetical protein
MHVPAFATLAEPDWRWRIVNYAGEVIEESQERFDYLGGRRPWHRAARAAGHRRSLGASAELGSTSHFRAR